MFFTPQALAANRHMNGHWAELWANRNVWNNQHDQMFAANRAAMSPEMLAANNLQFELNGNALAGLGREFWQEVDNQVIQLRNQEIGMEILDDLLGIQITLPIGKTERLYNMVGDIHDDVQVSMDGQAPYTFDSTEYSNDGDPVPIFTAGYGANWRKVLGLNTVGVDYILDSQRAKLRVYYRKLISYLLDGDSRIAVNGKPGQGLRTHRNTHKINLGSGAGGVNLDLTTATPEQLIAFFGMAGAFGQWMRSQRLARLDVLWVSYDVWANLNKPYLIDLGGANGQITGTVLDVVMRFAQIASIRPTYALNGNEFLGYVRRQDYVAPLVAMATGVIPLPRPMPQHNFNFQIMGAMGVQVTRDDEGLGGVVYGANLA
jgi:hypothetical protein